MAQWGVYDPNAFQRGWQNSQSMFDGFEAKRKQNALDAAMRGYAMNPNDPGAVNALAQVDPATAITIRQQQAATAAKEQERQRWQLINGAKIVRQLQPKDDATWQQALATARQMGIDVSEVPKTYDPNYVQSLIAAADALDPVKGEQPTSFMRDAAAAGIMPGTPEFRQVFEGRQMRFIPGPTGVDIVDPRAYVKGPTGPAASPGGGPEPGTVEDGYRFKGGDPARPENWEPVTQGGPTPRASGGFRP